MEAGLRRCTGEHGGKGGLWTPHQLPSNLRRTTLETVGQESSPGRGRGVLFACHLSPKLMLLGLALVLTISCAVAVARPPTGPPPAGHVWVQMRGEWIAVLAPPSEGPYEWVGGRWVPINTPPPQGVEWIPGHWGSGGWVPGHWAPVPGGPSGAVWVHGHWQAGVWIPGHWTGAPSVVAGWVPGHWGRHGNWVPGHWR